MKSTRNAKMFLVIATVAAGTIPVAPARAGDVSFTPPASPPYLWSSQSNWSSGVLPGSGDNVLLSAAALGASPLIVDGTTPRTVNELHLKPASGTTTLLEVASGASLTASKLLLGNSGSGGSYNGALARVDNYGAVNVTGFFMGRGNSAWATPGTPSVFHNHAGATFSHTGTGAYNFYLNQNGGRSLFINEGAMSNTSGSPLWLGLGQGNSELRIQGNGTFTANGEIRLGHGYPSTSYVILTDRGSITGTGAINLGYGSGQKATGYLILSNDSSIVKSGGRISLGTYTAGTIGHIRMNDSASLSLNDYLSVGDGISTRGTVEMTGNSAFHGVNVVLANANNSTGSVSMAGNSRFDITGTLYLGGSYNAGDNGLATMTLTDSAEASIKNQLLMGMRTDSCGLLSLAGHSRLSVTNDLYVGYGTSSRGKIEMAGNSSLATSGLLFVGYNAGSAGTVSVAGNATLTAPNIRVGQSSSSGLLALSDTATLFATNISIVNWGAATGTLEVGGGSVVTNLLAMTIGNSSHAGHDATLSMRGGAIFFDIDTENPSYVQNGYCNPINLNLWRTKVWGRIRGWGKVAFSDPVTHIANAAAPCGMTHYGQVIADGEGEARDLDFSRFGALNYSSTDANPSGTNGWFAVNKGRLRLPRSWPRKSNSAFCVGDCWTLDYSRTADTVASANRLANTFSATFTGADTGNYIFADLYATDRDDIPAGLDAIRPDRVISVWRIGLFADGPEADEPETPSSFTSADLRFRIPGDAVADAKKLYVAHHDGTANGKWTTIGRLVNPDSSWPIVPAHVDAPSSADWNLGWFAVIDRSTPFGFTFFVR